MTVLGVEYGCTYVLKGPDGARAVFNDSADKDFVGILGPESSGLDSADVREDATDAIEEDGGHHGDFYEGRRPVMLQGTIIATSAKDRNEKVNKLKRASRALREDATLTWQPQGGPEVELKLRRQQPLRITKGYVKDFQLPMVAANIFPKGTTTHEKTLGEVSQQDKTEPSSIGVSSPGTKSSAYWSTIENIKKSDNVRSVSPQIVPEEEKYEFTKRLSPRNFGFKLPANSIIVGVRPTVERKKSGPGVVKDYTLKLEIGSSPTGEDQKSSEAWPEADAKKSYGGASDTFGLSLTQAQVESTEFGFGIAASFPEKTFAEIDSMEMRVYYMAESLEAENAGDAPAYPTITVGGPFDIPIEIENVTTGKKIVLKPPKLETGTLTIDFKNHTIMLSGKTAYSWFQFTESQWFDLEPGVNKIRFAGIHVSPKVTWQDTYL